MNELTEPQVWLLIGVFAAAIFGLIGIVTSSFNRALKAAIGGVRSEISGFRETMDARFEVINGRFETMDARFETLDVKFSGKFEVLDRDIQALSRHVFGMDLR